MGRVEHSRQKDVSVTFIDIADISCTDHQMDQRRFDRRWIFRLGLSRYGRAFRPTHGCQTSGITDRKRTERREETKYGLSAREGDRTPQRAPTRKHRSIPW